MKPTTAVVAIVGIVAAAFRYAPWWQALNMTAVVALLVLCVVARGLLAQQTGEAGYTDRARVVVDRDMLDRPAPRALGQQGGWIDYQQQHYQHYRQEQR